MKTPWTGRGGHGLAESVARDFGDFICASFSSTFIRTDVFSTTRGHGAFAVGEVARDPPTSPFGVFSTLSLRTMGLVMCTYF